MVADIRWGRIKMQRQSWWLHACLVLLCVHSFGVESSSSSRSMNTTDSGKLTSDLPKGCKLVKYNNGDLSLDCTKADITTILPAIRKQSKNLTNVIVSDCEPPSSDTVYLAPSQFHGMTSLKGIQIFRCEIGQIQPSTFLGLSSLTTIDLSFNSLSTISDQIFKGVENLSFLSLRGQQNFHTIDATAFKETPNLRFLYLNNNPNLKLSTKSPDSMTLFTGLTKLLTLDLGNTGMLGFPTHRKFLPVDTLLKDQADSLMTLDLRGNKITNFYLPMVRNLKKITDLRLGTNELGYIEATSLPPLKNARLDLRDNAILSFAVEALDRMDTVKLDMRDNPIICDCNLAPFAARLRHQNGVQVLYAGNLTCGGPHAMYSTKVIYYDPNWWSCTPFFAIALVCIVAFFLLVVVIISIIYCNWVSIKHWHLARRELAFTRTENWEPTPLALPGERSSLRQGMTGAFVTYDYRDEAVLRWANKYLDEQLQLHSMKITLQWAAGPELKPLWKQVRDFSPQVRAFLVLMNGDFLDKHWPDIADKGGIENIMRFVVVLLGKKKSQLPKELKRLGCPCLEWPETGTKFVSLQRSRDLFWKELRIHLKGVSQ